jgi:hypothetical protein
MQAENLEIPGIVRVRVLLLIESKRWVAQCLDYDITAHGKTIPEAKNAFMSTFLSQMVLDYHAGASPLAGMKAAPKWYFDMYKRAERLDEPMLMVAPADESLPEAPPMRGYAEVRFVDPLMACAA